MNLKQDLKITDRLFRVNGNKIYINLIILLFFYSYKYYAKNTSPTYHSL